MEGGELEFVITALLETLLVEVMVRVTQDLVVTLAEELVETV